MYPQLAVAGALLSARWEAAASASADWRLVARLVVVIRVVLVEGGELSRVGSRECRQQVLLRVGVVVLVGEFAVVEVDRRAGGNGGGVAELDERDLRAVVAFRLGGMLFFTADSPSRVRFEQRAPPAPKSEKPSQFFMAFHAA